jgi:hypothetical protein
LTNWNRINCRIPFGQDVVNMCFFFPISFSPPSSLLFFAFGDNAIVARVGALVVSNNRVIRDVDERCFRPLSMPFRVAFRSQMRKKKEKEGGKGSTTMQNFIVKIHDEPGCRKNTYVRTGAFARNYSPSARRRPDLGNYRGYGVAIISLYNFPRCSCSKKSISTGAHLKRSYSKL